MGGRKETGNICEKCNSPSGGIVELNGVVDEVSTDNMEAMFLNLIRNAKEGKEAQSIMNVQLASAAKNILESEKKLKAEKEAHKATTYPHRQHQLTSLLGLLPAGQRHMPHQPRHWTQPD